jgi:putative multicomponent Na+:H+ antiporter subunit B
MMDSYVYVIMALLPLAAFMLVIQTSPYQALVIRGILGAIAALIYAVLGGADVALTEALVGTMLAITLYAVAVRSSLVMRLGVLDGEAVRENLHWRPLLTYLRALLNRYHLRLELVSYDDLQALHRALQAKEVHGTCVVHRGSGGVAGEDLLDGEIPADTLESPYLITLRIPRLYEIFSTELPPVMAQLKAFHGETPAEAHHSGPAEPPTLAEGHR